MKTSYRGAVHDAIADAMRADERVVLLGEDVGRYGGTYAVSKGMLEEFGPDRIRDTPISELGFVGIGIGAALGGLRPIVVQRPGFGLSDRASTDYLAAAAADLDIVCERLGLGAVRLVARANAAPAMLEFAARHPHRVRQGVLINPLTPLGFEQTAPGILTKISHTLMQHPKLTMTIVELFRRQSRSSLAERNLRRSVERVEVDRLCLQNPDVVLSLVRDAQALTAHTSAGMVDEMEVYGRGWRAPSLAGAAPWRIVHLEALACEPVFEPWRGLPGAELVVLAGAGRLADFTHPDELAALIT